MTRKLLVPLDAGANKIVNGANGTASTDFALFGQIPVIDATATDIQPAGVQSAGSAGKAADAGHVHPNYANLSLYLAPSGATAETFPRYLMSGQTASGAVSGTVYVNAIPMSAGLPVNNITLSCDATGSSGGTHGWYVLLDSGLVVRAVTADQTAAAVWTATTKLTLATTATYTTAYSGLYYVGWCAVATTTPTFTSAPSLRGAAMGAPILQGSSSTGQTTPPATGTTLAALTAAQSRNFYAYTS